MDFCPQGKDFLVPPSLHEGTVTVKHAYNAKVRKFQALCTSEGLAFVLLAVDTFGAWHKDSLAVITRLGTQ